MSKAISRALARALLLCWLVATWPLVSNAQRLVYRVDLTHAAEHYAAITIQLLDLRPDTLTFQMPVWVPGIYSEFHYGRFIKDLTAYDTAGHELSIKRVKTDRWKIGNATSIGEIRYRIENSASDNTTPLVGIAKIDADGVFANTEALFGYVNDNKDIPATIILTVPKDWLVATTLESASDGDFTDEARFHQLVYKVSDYESLADAPLIVAPGLKTSSFAESGVNYLVVAAGDESFPIDSFAMRARRVVLAETSFYGKVPFREYMFAVYAGSGRAERFGLAHAGSSIFTIAGADWAANGENDEHLIASTFFKTWNGKQFHISALGPVDFALPLSARSLWFNEGLSDYYADLLLVRYGYLTPSAFFDAIDRWEACAESSDHISLETLSERAAKYEPSHCEALRARGALAALLMDIEIRSRTHGQRSLDNVLLRMSSEASSGRTYDDKKFINTIEKFSDTPLDTIYVRYIAGTEPLPVEAYLDKLGAAKELPEAMKSNGQLGLDLALNAAGTAIITATPRDTVVHSPFEKGDTVTAINGERVSERAVAEAKAAARRGEPVKLKVVHNAHAVTVLVPGSPSAKSKALVSAKDRPSQLALRKALLGKRKVKRVKRG
ncbi:MAG: hypothetical protein Q8922_13570 [Bacteroidota bacterium]|nr:hypothetical protein [Bacteroidota bacterium]MDP4233682.1 hypothetical protein [Bacteroidota bacterium]MDP4241861.1 hypothetical protein [Bacteroidota bacterium]MDP4288951.1 hypothetical protein [Bacteroidota bacterium]